MIMMMNIGNQPPRNGNFTVNSKDGDLERSIEMTSPTGRRSDQGKQVINIKENVEMTLKLHVCAQRIWRCRESSVESGKLDLI